MKIMRTFGIGAICVMLGFTFIGGYSFLSNNVVEASTTLSSKTVEKNVNSQFKKKQYDGQRKLILVFRHNGYQLSVVDKSNNPRVLWTINKFVKLYFHKYPDILNYWAGDVKIKNVKLVVDPDYDGVAYTEWQNKTVVVSAKYISEHPNDLGLLTHELTHMAQVYPNYDSDTVWLTEGIADYSRYLFGPNDNGWRLPDLEDGQHYDDSYGVTARFLLWLEQHGYQGIVEELNDRLQENTYDLNDFKEITGKTIQQLWDDYVQNPEVETEY